MNNNMEEVRQPDISIPITRPQGHGHLDQKLDKGGRSPMMGQYPGGLQPADGGANQDDAFNPMAQTLYGPQQ